MALRNQQMIGDYMPDLRASWPPASVGVAIRGAILAAFAAGVALSLDRALGVAVAVVGFALAAWRWQRMWRREVAVRSINPEEYKRVPCDACRGGGLRGGFNKTSLHSCWKCCGSGWLLVKEPSEEHALGTSRVAPGEPLLVTQAAQESPNEPGAHVQPDEEALSAPSAPTPPTAPTSLGR
jgi:hypothetical protein